MVGIAAWRWTLRRTLALLSIRSAGRRALGSKLVFRELPVAIFVQRLQHGRCVCDFLRRNDPVTVGIQRRDDWRRRAMPFAFRTRPALWPALMISLSSRRRSFWSVLRPAVLVLGQNTASRQTCHQRNQHHLLQFHPFTFHFAGPLLRTLRRPEPGVLELNRSHSCKGHVCGRQIIVKAV